MSKSLQAPFRYDVVGSLKRSQALKDAEAKLFARKLAIADFADIQRAETKKIVQKQASLGFHAVTDGEFNRSWWHLDFLWGLGGTERYDYQQSYKFKDSKTRTDNVRLAGKIHYNPTHPFFTSFKYFNSVTPDGVLAKQTIPSPTLLFRDNRSDNWSKFYDSWDEYLTDVAKAYHETIQHFYDLGCRYLQQDDTTWAFLISKLNATKDQPDEHAKYVKLCEDAVKLINQELKGLPADLTITTHICRGNFKSTYLFSGSYDVIAKYLGQLNYDGFFLEYDNKRSGGFEPLKDIYNGRPNIRIVLGLITSKFPELENPDDVKARIKEASQYVPLDKLALSTQCGFASTEEGNKVTEDQQWKKLELVRDIARDVWGDAD
ncbi:vitamin B12 independent methionine synthase [Limosilactobacillus sp.]|uniref:vitamin B12 independent methionine synthase n=1 Tax=Limosilactobacillus sp. TaxID=2773925 RepID=UPI00345E410F